jgi:diadenylate cyclase
LVRPVLDILILAFLIYKGYQIMVKTQAVQLVRGAVFMVGVYALAFFLKLTTLQWILNLLAPGIVIAVAIVFQPELRKIFMRLGQGEWFRVNAKPKLSQLEAVLNAAEVLSGLKRGALIVFPRQVGIKNIIDTGTRLNADLSSSLIVTVFGHDTPLHDGAMIVQGGKIVAAGCFLPLSEQQDIRRSFGTRHRAALGLSEETDSIILIVSEETGAISLANDSKLYYDLNIAMIQRRLSELLDLRSYEAAEVSEATDEE